MLSTILIMATVSGQDRSHNELTDKEKALGFVLLFDGRSLSAFKGYGRDDVPNGWEAKGGEITFVPKQGSTDLSTREKYSSFDLLFEFKISKEGNSGVKILIAEDEGEDWPIGPEYQIIDDDSYPNASMQLTGANYAMHAPSTDVHKPAGEWNTARIFKEGNSVEYWLNGTKVVAYELYSEDWLARRKRSKYEDLPGYARDKEGFICFQDHGSQVWFRTVRIRRL